MRERLEKIRNGDTLFMPDIEGLDIKAFQAVVKQLDDLHAKGYIGSLKKEHSKRIGQYMDVIYVTVENGITESGMHYLDSRKGFSAS